VRPLLLACASCHDALELSPLDTALRAAGVPVQSVWFGTDAELAAATALGLRAPDRNATAPTAAAEVPLAAARFAAGLLAETSAAAVVTLGGSAFATAIALAATAHGLPVARLGAGRRTHDVDGVDDDRRRRLADHAASQWFTLHDTQRHELLREGLPAVAVHVVGSLLPAALAALPIERRHADPFVWLALERPASVAAPAPLLALLRQIARAALGQALPVRAAPDLLAAAVARHGVALPGGIDLVPGLSTRLQVDAARTATAMVTDSAAWQEFAAAAGVPCVLLGRATAHPELLAGGRQQVADPSASDLAQLLAVARQSRASERAPYADAVPALVAHLTALLAPAVPASTTAAPAPPVPALPSDGDHTGRTLGETEVALCAQAIRSGTLNSTRGTFVARFEREFAHWLGRKHVVACASGSAAVHVAMAALQLGAGDEVVTTPITDMGALVPILYEGAVPVFADVDPRTLNVTADTIRACLTDRTRAIVVTHLFGGPCELDAIVQLAAERGLPLVEDCAQAFGATWRGRRIGTFGAIATFSLQQGKHITTGEGGLVATDDDALARRLFLAVNKAWGYGDSKPDHYFPALNYRLGELQGAVACAQLPKLDHVVASRREVARQLTAALADVPGLLLPGDPLHGTHSWWKFAFGVDAAVVPGGSAALGKRMQADGVACAPRYIQKPAFECALFQDWRRSPVTWLPLQASARAAAPMPPFRREDFPGAVAALDAVVVLPINERWLPPHVAHAAAVIRRAALALGHA
jgi:perosamine synthetase